MLQDQPIGLYLQAYLRNKLGVVGLAVGYMEGAWTGWADYVPVYVSGGEKEFNDRYNINEVID